MSLRGARSKGACPTLQGKGLLKLVQILLPVRDNHGRKFKSSIYGRVRKTLIGRFGGVTAYTRSPARGAWRKGDDTQHDDMIILEVMTSRINAAWWKQYRKTLERTFRQDKIVVRAQDMRLL
jgi:hypothetical protein